MRAKSSMTSNQRRGNCKYSTCVILSFSITATIIITHLTDNNMELVNHKTQRIVNLQKYNSIYSRTVVRVLTRL